MPDCMVRGCCNRSGAQRKSLRQKKMELNEKITFHRLPLNPTKRKLWLESLQMSEPQSKCAMICSKHFSEVSFDRTSLSCVRLREDAIPSIAWHDEPAKKHLCSVKNNNVEINKVTHVDVYSSTLKFIKEENQEAIDIKDDKQLDHFQNSEAVPSREDTHKVKIEVTDTMPRIPPPETIKIKEDTISSNNVRVESSTSELKQEKVQKHYVSRSTSVSPERVNSSAANVHLEKSLVNLRKFYRHKIKMLHQNQRRREKRIAKLMDILQSVKQQNLLLSKMQTLEQRDGT
ncbi:THAP domain-containing protein 6 [Orussus abietinus]|uniref:THAP domain-containing protein 6 n=1 Tax=Orussus abietinus TaxID=222816 RepID=UPI0006260D6A|nr:THAP domain-containing protein 6 [Orussus abietinus]XP_012279393.1 THAP domain-containing protein 6 [Orussus abietinus]